MARPPTAAELRVLGRGLERYRQSFKAQPEAAKAWLGHGDRPVPAGLDPLELAAYTATASVILNLDETITSGIVASDEWLVARQLVGVATCGSI